MPTPGRRRHGRRLQLRILQSSLHWLWFITKCGKLTERFRYTPESVFDTWPWPQFGMGSAPAPGAADGALAVGTPAPSQQPALPRDDTLAGPKGCREGAATDTRGACAPLSQPSIAQITAVAEAGRTLRRVRAEALPKLNGGLRALYRTLELPGANPLKDAHAGLDAAALDTAVLAAYGFNPKQDLLVQLLALNLAAATKIGRGDPVTASGLPRGSRRGRRCRATHSGAPFRTATLELHLPLARATNRIVRGRGKRERSGACPQRAHTHAKNTPMKSELLLSVSFLACALSAVAQPRIVTIAQTTDNQTNTVTIADFEYVKFLTVVGSRVAMSSTHPTVEISKPPALLTYLLGDSYPSPMGVVVAGPAEVTVSSGGFYPGSGSQPIPRDRFHPILVTLEIGPTAYPVTNSVVLGPGQGAEINLQSSTDLVQWIPATNGVYTAEPAMFFRLYLRRLH